MIDNIHNALDDMPQFLSSRQLVQLGLYPSLDAVYLARVRGQSPDFMKLKRKILYPQHRVLAFIEQNKKKGTSASFNSNGVAQKG